MSHADLIVVGAGSAGCLLAARLAQELGFRVTLVEPSTTPAPAIDRQRPSRWLNLLGSSDDWDLRTEPCAALAGRKLAWPRGRGLGGSSRINAMIWFPPTERDLRTLVEASGHQWTANELESAYQSTRGMVRPEPPLWLSEASQRCLRAISERPEAAPMVYDRVNRQGRRWNPASLLEVGVSGSPIELVRATADRLLWDGDRAIGIRLLQGNNASDLLASQGIVLCAGTIATPTILMRSGIGPRDQLARQHIDVRVEHPKVGRNLQDHLIMPLIFRTRSKVVFEVDATMRDLARWQTLGTGPIGSNLAECGGLVRGDTYQIHVTPTNYLTYPKQPVASVMTVGINLTQPSSRGSIGLRRGKCTEQPWIDAEYWAHESDRDAAIEGIRWVRSLVSETSLAEWIEAEELPGLKRRSDESIAKSMARYVQSLYHPVGTCSMGCESDSVVDAGFSVRDTEGLWVVDASILPKLTVGNPNATVMTLAWKAADAVAGKIAGR